MTTAKPHQKIVTGVDTSVAPYDVISAAMDSVSVSQPSLAVQLPGPIQSVTVRLHPADIDLIVEKVTKALLNKHDFW